MKLSAKSPTSFTKCTTVYRLCSKDQANASLQLFVTSTVIPLGKRIIRWHVDRESEFMGDEFKAYCLEAGITLEFATHNTPPQIGVSEHVGRTLYGIVRCAVDVLHFCGESSWWRRHTRAIGLHTRHSR